MGLGDLFIPFTTMPGHCFFFLFWGGRFRPKQAWGQWCLGQSFAVRLSRRHLDTKWKVATSDFTGGHLLRDSMTLIPTNFKRHGIL